MTSQEREELVAKGWQPLDVRLLPNDSDGERAACLKFWLEGMRLGTVECSASVAKYVEIEARVYGLTSGRNSGDEGAKPKSYDDMSFDELLTIGGVTGHPTDEKQLEAPPAPRGRPQGVPDSYKREEYSNKGQPRKPRKKKSRKSKKSK